jgi:hypothetical protein
LARRSTAAAQCQNVGVVICPAPLTDAGRDLDEGIPSTYVARVLRLTLLAPEMIKAILNGTQGPEVTLARVLEPFSVEWEEQRKSLRQCT